jgi:hypothetical protein
MPEPAVRPAASNRGRLPDRSCLTAWANQGKLLDASAIRTPHFRRIRMAVSMRKGGRMRRLSSSLLALVVGIGMLSGVVAEAGQARKPTAQTPKAAGAVTFSGTVATPPGGSSGVTWGKGTLILNDGTQHGFEVSGLGITGSREAIVSVQAVGEVFNLRKLADFEGTYKVTDRQIVAGRGSDQVSLINEHGVMVSLSLSSPATTKDVTLTPSPTGIGVKLEK